MNNTATAKRVSIIRKVGWLSVASMLALAMLAPSAGTVFAADAVQPVENDNACNNVVSGADSAFVWLTTSDEGLTVHWDTSAGAFGAGGTVVVRACVDGQGAWSQNDTNDGIELFPWSLFGLETSPCPGADGTLGGSVDGGGNALQTQKSNGQSCTPETTTTTTTGNTTSTTTTGETTSTTTTGDTTSTTTTGVTTSTTTTGVTTSTTTTGETTSTSSTATTTTPQQSVEGETDAPTPNVTLPPTDTLGGPAAPSNDSWRLLLIAGAALLASVLVLSPAKASRRR